MRDLAGAATAALGLGAGLLVAIPGAQAATNPQVVATVSVPSWPHAVAVDSNTGNAFVGAAGNVVSINEATKSVTATASTPSFNPDSIAVDPKTGLVFEHGVYVPATGRPQEHLRVFNEATLSQVFDSEACIISNAALAVDSTTGTLFLACRGYGQMFEFNEATMAFSQLIVPGSLDSVSVDQTTGTVYASMNASPTDKTASVATIDEATKSVTATIPIGTGGAGIAVAPAHGKVFVAHDGNSVSVIDEKTNQVTKTVNGLSGAVGVAVDPVSKRVFVTDGAHSVAVIDPQGGRVTETLSTGTPGGNTVANSDPGVVAVNSTTGMAYVVDADADSALSPPVNQTVSMIQ